jgi:hypothetical protein
MPLRAHMHIIVHTIMSVICCALIATAVFFFLSGSQIFEANRERVGVHMSRFFLDGDTHVSGGFMARSTCAHVDVLTEESSADALTVYLTEAEDMPCVYSTASQAYTFTTSFRGIQQGPIHMYINGDAIPVIE